MIRINVGGVHYETLLATLCSEESMLSSMFSGKHKLERDKDGCPFIDRPGVPFGYILNFLRDRSMMPPKDFIMQVWEILSAINLFKFFLIFSTPSSAAPAVRALYYVLLCKKEESDSQNIFSILRTFLCVNTATCIFIFCFVLLQVYTEALYYQISTLVKKLENTPQIFRLRLREARKSQLKNFDLIKEMLIQRAQRKSQENLTPVATVGLITSSDKKKLDDPAECVLSEHLLSVQFEGNCKQEKFAHAKRRLEGADIIVDDDEPDFSMKSLMEVLEMELQSDGYQCKIWSEKWKCLYKSNYTRRECRFEIMEYFVKLEWT